MHELTTQGEVQERVGAPSAMVTAKMITHLDPGALTWIAAAAVMVASLLHDDDMDVVIGGGPPGWASGDMKTLRLPCNSLDAPERLAPGSGFGSIFLVPSLNEILRVNGHVASNDGAIVEIAVEECYIHCGKALIRSDFWSASAQPALHGRDGAIAERCRFLGLATSDREGHSDLSPKGDPAGLMVRLVDDILWFADRPGNKRIDSFRNIIDQPKIAAALLVPGTQAILVVKGIARITDDIEARQHFAVADKVPELVTQVTCDTIEHRVSEALGLAHAWPAPPAPAGLSAGKIAAGHLKLAKGLGARLAGAAMSIPGLVERELAKDYKKNLY